MAAHDLFDPTARRRARSARPESHASRTPTAADAAVAPALAPPRRGGRAFWAVIALLAALVAGGVVGLRRGAAPTLAASAPSDASLVGDAGAASGRGGAAPATANAGGEVLPAAPAAGRHAPAIGRPVDAGAIQRFVFWAEQGGAGALATGSEPGHPAVREGIALLADALAAVGGDAARVEAVRARADQLGGSQTDAAAHVHAALVDAARLLGTLRGDGAPELVAATRGVLPGQPLDAQGPAVRVAFQQAAAALPAR